MTKQHPITPPPELIQELAKSAGYIISPGWFTYALEKVFQAGADHALRQVMRPKPPSLKEQALSELNLTADSNGAELSSPQVKLIRKALEQLPE
jgi:hypothetical protein